MRKEADVSSLAIAASSTMMCRRLCSTAMLGARYHVHYNDILKILDRKASDKARFNAHRRGIS